MNLDNYRPQRSCEGYVFTGVCLSTRGDGILACLAAGLGGGGVLSQHALQVASQHALQQVSRGVLSQHALQVVSQHALQQVSRGGVPVQGGLLLGGAWSRGSAPRGCLVGGVCSRGACTEADPPRERWLLLQMVCIPLEY